MIEKPLVQIKDWMIVGEFLLGTVIDHPKFNGETDVRTSKVITPKNKILKGEIIETVNTRYKLLNPVEISAVGSPQL